MRVVVVLRESTAMRKWVLLLRRSGSCCTVNGGRRSATELPFEIYGSHGKSLAQSYVYRSKSTEHVTHHRGTQGAAVYAAGWKCVRLDSLNRRIQEVSFVCAAGNHVFTFKARAGLCGAV